MRTGENLPNGRVTILGEDPFARSPGGKLKARIATAFPSHDTIVTVPGIHVTQRQAFLDYLDELRRSRAETRLTKEERDREWGLAVDLIVVEGAIQIRPDPDNMALAFLADELLQRLIPKHRIRFLGVLNERVREAIKRRGELWRIAPLPITFEEMRAMIDSSRISSKVIGSGAIRHSSPLRLMASRTRSFRTPRNRMRCFGIRR
ncbi:MAG: hypothetical protein ACHQ1F_06105, partial [Spirochaetia bacterium]